MKKLLISALITTMSALAISPVSAHQPVVLLDTDTTAENGPLLVDGTISFAIRASFSKSGQKKAFRAAFKEGDQLDVQYLIVDKKPENTLKNTLLPQLVITSPTGKKTTIKFTERTKFYEPWGRTNYLYLARISTPAEAGIYSFVATSRAKSAITIAVGEKEVTGEVLRGPAPVATPVVSAKPAPTPEASPTATASPTPEVTTASGYTMAKVKENNSATSCWSLINGNVYDLTKWINSHPGGASAIKGICGRDGSSNFNGRHGGQSNPAENLAMYILGPLAK